MKQPLRSAAFPTTAVGIHQSTPFGAPHSRSFVRSHYSLPGV